MAASRIRQDVAAWWARRFVGCRCSWCLPKNSTLSDKTRAGKVTSFPLDHAMSRPRVPGFFANPPTMYVQSGEPGCHPQYENSQFRLTRSRSLSVFDPCFIRGQQNPALAIGFVLACEISGVGSYPSVAQQFASHGSMRRGRPERPVLGVLEPDTWQGELGFVILAHLFFHGPRPTLNRPRSTPEIVNNKPKSI